MIINCKKEKRMKIEGNERKCYQGLKKKKNDTENTKFEIGKVLIEKHSNQKGREIDFFVHKRQN